MSSETPFDSEEPLENTLPAQAAPVKKDNPPVHIVMPDFSGEKRAIAAPSTNPQFCLKCRKRNEGEIYSFTVKAAKGLRVLYREKSLVCNQCAKQLLGHSRFGLWAQLLMVSCFAGVGVLATLLVVRRGRIFLTAILLLGTIRYLRGAFRKLGEFREPVANDFDKSKAVARQVIQLRKQDVLKKLHLSASDVIFVTE